MSSSPSLLSSSDTARPAQAGGADNAVPFPGLMDVQCKGNIRLGTRRITVRECLALKQQSIIRLVQLVGDDLQVCVEDVVVANGEVVMVDDSTSIRLTDTAPSPGPEADQ